MIKVITAIGNEILNKKLSKEEGIEILAKDIQYTEGIFEILEKYKKIDFLIISELLNGELLENKIIKKIKEKNKQVKIIFILEKENKYLENLYYKKEIYKIFYRHEIEIKKIIDTIKNNHIKQNEKSKEELKKLKQFLNENNIEKNKKQNDKKIPILSTKNLVKQEIKESKKVISILGTGGVGKSIFSVHLVNHLIQNNYKIAIIDFDILNNSLHTILGVNKYPEKIKKKIKENHLNYEKLKIKDLIIKINKNLDLISGINLMFDNEYKINSNKIFEIIYKIKQEYDYILIDTSSECFFDYTKNIIENSDINIFLMEGNLLEIEKSKRLLDMYVKQWNIKKDKIKLVINKYNKNTIDDKIMNHIFHDFFIIGKIKLNEKYNIFINKNFEKTPDKNIEKEYKKISDKIIKLKNRKIKIWYNSFFKKQKINHV